jgi:hypothetical protein
VQERHIERLGRKAKRGGKAAKEACADIITIPVDAINQAAKKGSSPFVDVPDSAHANVPHSIRSGDPIRFTVRRRLIEPLSFA